MTRELKVGVIGAGHWATEAHIPGFQACEGVAVVAVSDIEAERAAKAAQALGVPRAYASAEEMLAAETLDAVSIVTPDDTHAGYALAAMARGIAVLCEKPLARTAKEALALADRAEQAGVVNKVGFTMRYTPSLLYLRELVEQGFFGELYLFQCFIQNAQFLDPQKPRHWKMTMEHAGGGVIVEYGIHMLDIARLLVGDIRRVSAKARTFVPERPAADGRGRVPVEVDDSCVWLMDFANGALGSGHAGWTTIGRPPGTEIRIYGSQAAAQVVLSDDLPGSESLRIATAPEHAFQAVEIPPRFATPMPISAPWYRRFHQNLVRHFVEEVRMGRSASPTFRDGAHANVLLEAVIAAMTEGRWVDIG